MKWKVERHPSGSTVVKQHGGVMGEMVWLYVIADTQKQRQSMCTELAAFLNGTSERPPYLNDYERVNDEELQSIDGSQLIACGPMYDANPPALEWRRCEDLESKIARKELIDRLEGKEQLQESNQ